MLDGIKTAIIGRPNVGKSSLLNTLVQEEKAIVTDIPGTTRDVIEEYVNVRGIPLRLIDTAGIRETEDVVEKIGVERSRKILSEAELVLFMVNYSEPLTEEDEAILHILNDTNFIVIVNKADLEKQLNVDELKQMIGNRPLIFMSLIRDEGIDQLEETLSSMFFSGHVSRSEEMFISNVRHIHLLNKAKEALRDAEEALKTGVPLDLVQIDVTRTWEFLGEIIGETASEQLIDQLFSQFCLGK